MMMIPGTAPLRDRQQAATIAAKNAQTVELLRRDLVEAQKERIADLEAEVEALRAVAVAAEWAHPYYDGCPICTGEKATGHEEDCPYPAARAAGYLREAQP